VRKNSDYHELWKETRLFEDYRQMLDEVRPDAVFIGTPPLFHGSLEAPRDIELQCLKRNIHMFIEKPISCAPVEEVELITKALQQATQEGLVISIGYMFRYR
jgi:predicted dehydrogenase